MLLQWLALLLMQRYQQCHLLTLWWQGTALPYKGMSPTALQRLGGADHRMISCPGQAFTMA